MTFLLRFSGGALIGLAGGTLLNSGETAIGIGAFVGLVFVIFGCMLDD